MIVIKVQCPGCQKNYSLPDEKIPADKDVSLPCPACGAVITVRKPAALSPVSPDPTPDGEALMKDIIKNSRALPPMPQIIAKANEVLSNENAGFKEVGDVLATDQAMATRVLKLANSAYYGLRTPVSSVQQASALLGFQTLMELITVVSTSKMMGKSLTGYGIEAREVWKHSLSVAIGAKLIAEKKYPALIHDAFNAGLIHDSGMVILDDHVAKGKAVFDGLLDQGATLQEAERRVFGFDHGLIAAEFFKKWKLPPAQIHAIRFHHDPALSGDDPLTHILHAADTLANEDALERNYTRDPAALASIGLSDEEWASLKTTVTESVEHIMATMG